MSRLLDKGDHLLNGPTNFGLRTVCDAQRRRMEGLARVNDVRVPEVATHAEAEQWIAEQEARQRRDSLHEEL